MIKTECLKMEKITELAKQYSQGKINLPSYQRGKTWTGIMKAKLIDSLIQNLPIGMIIIGKLDGEEYLEDGQQRLSTIAEFINGELKYSTNRMSITEKAINGHKNNKYFNDFGSDERNSILNAKVAVHRVSFDSIEEAMLAFSSLNLGGSKLNKGENINAIFAPRIQKKLNDLSNYSFITASVTGSRCAKLEFLVDILGSIDTQMKNPYDTFDANEIVDWAKKNRDMSNFRLEKLKSVLKKGPSTEINKIFEPYTKERLGKFQRKAAMYALIDALTSLYLEGFKLSSREDSENDARNALIHFVNHADLGETHEAIQWMKGSKEGLGKRKKRKMRRDLLKSVLRPYFEK